MTHPFEKMFLSALTQSLDEENQVLAKAEQLREKGYRVQEIHTVLKQLSEGLINDAEAAVVKEAAEELALYL